ncbi:MAG: class I SAM-dependent methyltransferase [Mesorhizobium sp.]|uniref:class I SAM-dependent methyltransferase n=1 Tax=Mesorhizobium sp. TaxID=1871066 RepID=UPI0012179D3A|nr:class I SAM-dependent methyltransferase [Mesorhizobium sp.]TIL86787.1 MAG: class I SAM-dependent methyltransferase [Mesorhizobium sp.]TIL97444.1 MAG: class I SAM-dependent methyltransferase [Mesorhizobium sp.]
MTGDEVKRLQETYSEYLRAGRWRHDSPGHQQMAKERSDAIETLINIWSRPPLSKCRILDVGCGYGNQLGWFNDRGVQPENLFGVDLLPAHIEISRKRYPTFNLIQSNAEHLSFPDYAFDIVIAFKMAENIASEMLRVLKKSGAILWYDLRYPSPRNRSVRAMTRRRISRLFPGTVTQLKSTSLLPPLANGPGRRAPITYPLLAGIPFLRSHYLGLTTATPPIP